MVSPPYNAEQGPAIQSITSLLSLLRDETHSFATIKRVLEKIRETVQFLNPGETPEVAVDQPFYSLAKQIQWQ